MANVNWKNADGLFVKFGRNEGETGVAGEFRYHGPEAVAEFKLDLTSLGSDAVLDYNFVIPEGVRVSKVETVIEETPVSAGGANWNLGLWNADTLAVFDADGLIVAADGEIGGDAGVVTEYTNGSTDSGAELGNVTASAYLLSASADTSTFSAGVLNVRVYYYKP